MYKLFEFKAYFLELLFPSQIEFSVAYSPVFESSIYDFRLVSLPTADLQFDTNDDTLAVRIRTKIGKASGM
jgi:hypothetical protein